MSDGKQTRDLNLSRRQLLGASGAIGASGIGAGLGANALLSDLEGFANNRLTAGELDLKVDWTVAYFDGLAPNPEIVSSSDVDGDGELELVDEPGPIVDLRDVKPGDVIEHTISLHLFGNPGFIRMNGGITANGDAGITEPEDGVDGTLDGADGTPDGDLADHLQCVVWYDDGDPDPGNNFPEEITDYAPDERDRFVDDLISGDVSFDVDADEFAFGGTVASLLDVLESGLLLDPGEAAAGTNEQCFEPSTTRYVGILCWLPLDIPGVDDNVVQGDRLGYDLGFDAIQCRNNGMAAEPLTFEVTQAFASGRGEPIDLQADAGFPENMRTTVEASGDSVEFVLDVPAPLSADRGDRWSLVVDADDDGTVDFRILSDGFGFQEWDDQGGQWGPTQPTPPDIGTSVDDGNFVVEIPRDRLSDPFAFAGRLCYGGDATNPGLDASTELVDVVDVPGGQLCVSFTGSVDPRVTLGPGTTGFEHFGFGSRIECLIEKDVSVVQLCYDFDNCRLLDNSSAKACYKQHVIDAINAKLKETPLPPNKLKPIEKSRVKTLYDVGIGRSGKTVGVTIPVLLRRDRRIDQSVTLARFRLCIVMLVPCHGQLQKNLPASRTISCGGGSKCTFTGSDKAKKTQRKNAKKKWGNGKSWEEGLHNHEKGHALASCLACKMLECLILRTSKQSGFRKAKWIKPLWDPNNSNSPLVQVNSKYHANTGKGMDPAPAARAAAWDTFKGLKKPGPTCLQKVFGTANRKQAIQSGTKCGPTIPNFK